MVPYEQKSVKLTFDFVSIVAELHASAAIFSQFKRFIITLTDVSQGKSSKDILNVTQIQLLAPRISTVEENIRRQAQKSA